MRKGNVRVYNIISLIFLVLSVLVIILVIARLLSPA